MDPLRLLALVFLAAGAASARAQTVINAVPYTISVSGNYRLGTNLITASAAQTAITISAPNVILDLNGYFVSGSANTTTSNTPVIAVGNVSSVTIRNGTVANNGNAIVFFPGTNSINHLVEDVNVTRCLRQGIFFQSSSSGSIVRRNVITQTGGYTGSTNAEAFAIALAGGVRAEKNVIVDVTARGTGGAYGISGSGGDFMIANTVSNGSGGSVAVGVVGGKYQRNLILNFGTPFANGTDAGGNF